MGEKNAEISARVAEMIESLGQSPNSFAKALGYKRAQTIYDILSGKSAPSYDFFNKVAVAEISATINLNWLLTGIGDIKVNKSQDSVIKAEDGSERASSGVITQFFEALNAKDDTIREQAEEIGRLRERILQLEKELRGAASDAQSGGAANVG